MHLVQAVIIIWRNQTFHIGVYNLEQNLLKIKFHFVLEKM